VNPAFDRLLPYLQNKRLQNNHLHNKPLSEKPVSETHDRCLLVADENLSGAGFTAVDAATEVISNRFDIAQEADAVGLSTQFNDFDFSTYPPGHFARICYRISKEKAVVEHIIDQSLDLLRPGGELILCGAKNEGLKRYAGVAAKYFGNPADTRKHGAIYVARISKNTSETPSTRNKGDSDYRQMIPVEMDSSIKGDTSFHNTLYTKPGSFGAAKIDQGSAMLASYLETFFQSFQTPPQSLLDLGCGYGYLTAYAAQLGSSGSITRIVATDNCAAAIITCQANMARMNISAEVIGDDCAQGIRETFDAVVCNPPFHQGFKTDSTLSEKFVRAAAEHLSSEGKALFVANQFVPLEKAAARIFRNITVVQKDQGFKLISLSHPLRVR
jgi:16S rRNA (guanine1207-N2)-methyltransferase